MMNKLKRMFSFSIALLAFCFFVVSATLSSCANGESADNGSTEQSTIKNESEHPNDEGEHPAGDDNEHPEGEEHPE